MENICLQSQGLTEVPESIFEEKVKKLNLEFNDIVSLPLKLCEKLPNLTFLSLNGNTLETLPSNIGLLTGLTDLYLKENSLVSLPESIVELKNLQRLHITGNNIQKLPENIHKLEKLNELVADENAIQCLPCSFGNLKHLSHLNLSFNAIETLSTNFGSLERLKELDLSNNCLKQLPDTFHLLPSLEVVDLNANDISHLPDNFESARSLKKFLIAQNRLSVIPRWFTEMKKIKEIFMSENNLHETPFPEDFGSECGELEQIDLSGNNITSLPESIGKLRNLTFLDLGSSYDELERNRMISNGNDIVYLPSTFCDLKNLSKLELDENQIKELPDNFGLLSNLAYLDLSHNLLKSLPDSFGDLQKLKVCMLSMNYMTQLPESFGMLASIQDLKLDNNMLEQLPESFKNLTTIISLDLYNNKLKEPPVAVKNFKCLKSLDLRENDFGSTIEALAIAYEPTYPIRDPEQQNNWRGRKRQDIQPTSWVERKTEVMNKEHLENDILYNAMVSASSLWRRHGQSDSRSKNLSNQTQASIEVNSYSENETLNEGFEEISALKDSPSSKQEIGEQSICNNSNDVGSESLVEEEPQFWDEDLQLNASSSKSSSSYDENDCNSVVNDFEHSDWEEEYELEFPKNFTRTYKHPVTNLPNEVNAPFVPSDLHINSACGPEIWDTVEEGQFDDVDS